MDLCGLVKELRPQRKLFSTQWKVRFESLRQSSRWFFLRFYIQLIFVLYNSDQTYKQVLLFKAKNIFNKFSVFRLCFHLFDSSMF